jgi:hypothetical protein
VEDTFTVSCAGSTELRVGETRPPNKMSAPDDINEFCAKMLIKDDVAKTLMLARQNFAVLGDPTYEIVEDSECQELYLAIHVNVAGEPDRAFEQSNSFLDSFVTAIDPGKQRRINLVYRST